MSKKVWAVFQSIEMQGRAVTELIHTNEFGPNHRGGEFATEKEAQAYADMLTEQAEKEAAAFGRTL